MNDRVYTRRTMAATKVVVIINKGMLHQVWAHEPNTQVTLIDCDEPRVSNDNIDYRIGEETEGLAKIYN